MIHPSGGGGNIVVFTTVIVIGKGANVVLVGGCCQEGIRMMMTPTAILVAIGNAHAVEMIAAICRW